MTQKKYPLDFLIIVPLNRGTNGMEIVHTLPSAIDLKNQKRTTLYLPSHNKFRVSTDEHRVLVISSDPVGLRRAELATCLSDQCMPDDFLTNTHGHYYLIRYDRHGDRLIVASSLFSMYPVFWYRSKEGIFITSRLRLLFEVLPTRFRLNDKFIIEQFLFNYPLFNDTVVNEVQRCPTNTYLAIYGGKIEFKKYFDVGNLFVATPRNGKATAADLTILFLQRVKEYFPAVHSIMPFTGGFDSRTLIACAKYHDHDFTAFSFGTKTNEDVTLATFDAKRLAFDYIPILLDEKDYVENHYQNTGNELIELTSGMSNYLYVHFLHSAKKLSERGKYLLTGYGGSELFRTVHHTGAMISKELLSFFKYDDEERWIEAIKGSPKLAFIRDEYAVGVIDQIIDELREYKGTYYDGQRSHFFYRYLMEEIFRKVFGHLIYSQANYLNIRTPFLDLPYIKELLRTQFAGVYSDFFTQNPLKRSIGQYLNANIINTAYPELSLIKTQRGYCPRELLSTTGKLYIALPYTLKKIRRYVKKPDLDNLAIISGLKSNWSTFRQQIRTAGRFDVGKLDALAADIDHIPEYQRDLLALAASSAQYLNQFPWVGCKK